MASVQRYPVVVFMSNEATSSRAKEMGCAFNTTLLLAEEADCREQLISKVKKCFNVFVSVIEPFPTWTESLSLVIPNAKILNIDLTSLNDIDLKEFLGKYVKTSTSLCPFTSYSNENQFYFNLLRELNQVLEQGAPPGEEYDELERMMPQPGLHRPYNNLIPFKKLDPSCPDFIASKTPQLYYNPEDFWNKVWDNSSVIVQLNAEYDYLNAGVQHEGDLVITLSDRRVVIEGAVVATKLLLQKSQESKEVIHYLFTNWIDGDDYKDSRVLDFVIDRVREFHLNNPQMTPLVHCTAGLGRTGTFLGAYLKRHLLVHADPLPFVDKNSFAKDVTIFLRLFRSGAVLTLPQYLLLDSYDPK